jgi:hypothetical protein
MIRLLSRLGARAYGRGILALALLCGIGGAHASPLYGVISNGVAASGNGPSTFPNQAWNFGQNGVYQLVTSYTSPVLSASGSYTVGADTVTGSATSWASSNGGSLHGFAAATLSGLCGNCSGITENGGVFGIEWTDTIYVSGLPNGTPVDLMLTDVLHISSSHSGNASISLFASLSMGNQSIQLLNNQGASDGLITQTSIVHTISGTELQLSSELTGSANVAAIGAVESATGDASDTALSYITVLTPGASYTSASGFDYAAPAGVPEPRSVWLLGASLIALLGSTHRRSMDRSGT